MAISSQTRVLLTVLLALPSACLAQTPPAQSNPSAPCPAGQPAADAAKPCAPPATDSRKPSTAEQFPFPGKAAPPPQSTPDSPKPGTTPSSAAAEHPFPTAPPPRLPGDDSSSSSSSSSSSADDPAATPDTPTPAPGTEGSSVHRHPLPKVKHVQSDDERVDEDLRVAKFYMNDENLPGAYLRAKDAVKVQPDYSATHFMLAEVAMKMKKKDEAIAEYQSYLKLDPAGEKAKAAQKALDDLR